MAVKTIGILGGGQLAQMMLLAGLPLGLDCTLYVPRPAESTKSFSRQQVGPLAPCQSLENWLNDVDVVTFENENIPANLATWILQRKPLYPGNIALACCQNRLLEKQLFAKLAIPTNDWLMVNDSASLLQAARSLGYPFILKTSREGYDGKGQHRIQTEAELDALTLDFSGHPWIAEAWVDFESEISIVGVRSQTGETRCYDICLNHHEQGILLHTNNLPTHPLSQLAQSELNKVMNHFNHIGILTIEFFVKDGQLLANEMAPRVHNSGHWTIEGAACSQFENHLRAIAGLPLGDTGSSGLWHMENIISQWPQREGLLAKPGWHIHDYHKTAKPGRKLGHITYLR